MLDPVEGGQEEQIGPGTRFGRFTIVKLLGAGGMGAVYEARDSRLERTVALKVLRGERTGGRHDARLLREAQALAQLAHPNVVAVHEAGDVDGRIFLAMEHIDGTTLDAFLAVSVDKRPRSWRELLPLFVQAARGLAAAHERRIAHRDFKPSNVLVDKAGRVRVSDFGLARLVGEGDGEPPEGPSAAPDLAAGGTVTIDGGPHDAATPASSAALLGAVMTHEGAIVGTPRYMAPEQRAGRPATEKSDQYAFCVVFWEALHGRHPFGEGANARRAPRWLDRALQRGLAEQPAARHPSMAALLEILEGTPVRRRRAATLAIGVLAAASAATAAWALAPSGEDDPRCARDRAAEIWNPTSRAALFNAFGAARGGEAQLVHARVDAVLASSFHGWSEAMIGACAERPRSPARLTCLDRVVSRLQLLLDVWQKQPVDLARAFNAARSSGDLVECRDREGLSPVAAGTALTPVHKLLDEVTVLDRTGDNAAATERAGAALRAARAAGDPALVAEALIATGHLDCEQGRSEPGLEALRESVRRAGEARDDVRQATALSDLIFCTGMRAKRASEAAALVPAAEAAVARLPGRADLRARLFSIEASLYKRQGRYTEAVDLAQQSLAIIESLRGPDDDRTLATLGNLAGALSDAGRKEESLAMELRVLHTTERIFGARNPRIVQSLLRLQMLSARMGRVEAAAVFGERGLQLGREVLPPDHPDVLQIMSWLAEQRSVQGRFAEGQRLNDQAITGGLRRLGADHPDVIGFRLMAATFLDDWGRLDEAQAQFDAARASLGRSQGNEPIVSYAGSMFARHLRLRGDLAGARRAVTEAAGLEMKLQPQNGMPDILGTQADVAYDEGRREEAARLAAEARAALARTHAGNHAKEPAFVARIARCLIDDGKAAEAAALLDPAVRLGEQAGAHPLELAEVRFQLARASWELGDHARARALAEASRVTLAARRQPALAAVERWQRAHRGS